VATFGAGTVNGVITGISGMVPPVTNFTHALADRA
jgi:hypothetical protein